MYHIKKVTFYFFCVMLLFPLHAGRLPPGVLGTSNYDPFIYALPYKSRGVYQVIDGAGAIKYVGSSLDINKRLTRHAKNGVLQKGDSVYTYIFDDNAGQREILDFERALIKTFSPLLNKHTGTPGRPWRSDQLSKLQIFFDHNYKLLTPQGQEILRTLIRQGTLYGHNKKMSTSILRALRLFR